MILLTKTLLIIILGVDYLINNNSRAIIPLFSFFSGCLVFYSFFLENYFASHKNIIILFNYYMSMIYMLSGIFILIGYILKTEIKNFFFIFILGNIILILILYFWVFRVKIINFRDESQILKEKEIYLHTKNLLLSITDKSYNRELMLNFLEYQTFQTNNVSQEIKEENKDYNLYLIVEKALKRRMVYHRNSVLLKIIHFIILKNYLKNHKSAYLLLYHLYLDIENEIITVSQSQKFFIFRLKKSIEDDSIEFNYNKNDISMRYQINSLIDLIIKVSEMYYAFWSLLLTSTKIKEIKKINEMGGEIHKLIVEIENKFNEIENIKQKNSKVFLLYGYYLRDILNNKEKADKYLNADFTKIQEKSNYKNKNDYIPNSDFQFFIISMKKNKLIIERISKEFCIDLGYLPGDLIGKNINILFPALLKEGYEIEFKNKLKNINYKGERTIFYFKTKAKYLKVFPIDLKLNYDEEHNYYLLCELVIEQFELLNRKTKASDCHILTDIKCLINLFSSNSIYLLKLNNKYINNSIDLSIFIKEFHDEIINITTERNFENNSIVKLKNSILKQKYINKENENKWTLTNSLFHIDCKEIYLNKKLTGYYFHMRKVACKTEKRLTIVKCYNHISQELLPTIKKIPLKTKTVKKKSSTLLTRATILGDKLVIDDDFIPPIDKEVNFFPQNRYYLFYDKKDNVNHNNIENYVKKKYMLNKEIARNSTKFYRTKTKRRKTVNFLGLDSSSSSSFSFSDSNNYFTDEQSENSNTKSSEEIPIENLNEEEENIDLNDNINQIEEEIEEEQYYNIKKCKAHFYIYDYEKHVAIEVENYIFKSQVEIVFEEERNLNINRITSNKLSRKSKIKLSILNTINENENNIIENNSSEEKQEIFENHKSSCLNIYILIWLITIFLHSFDKFIVILFTIFFWLFILLSFPNIIFFLYEGFIHFELFYLFFELCCYSIKFI